MKSLLIEDAARAVKGLALINKNYIEAIKILDESYSKLLIIVNGHTKELTKVSGKLRKMGNKV